MPLQEIAQLRQWLGIVYAITLACCPALSCNAG